MSDLLLQKAVGWLAGGQTMTTRVTSTLNPPMVEVRLSDAAAERATVDGEAFILVSLRDGAAAEG